VAVLDAAGADRVHVLANADTGMIALQLAAEHPDRVASVTAVNPYPRAGVGDGYPHGEPASMEDGRRLAEHLPCATLVEHPDPNGVWFLGDVDWVLTQFAAFAGSPP
jgi:pimeloyl-ACP methyl ester carboxylesterase